MTRAELLPAIAARNGGAVLACHVQPNASKTAVVGMYGDELKITLKTPPVDGKANQELCRYFAELLDLPPSRIQLISGQTSRRKRIFIPVEPEILLRKLSS